MEDEPEELGAEVSPLNASKYYASFTNSLRLRLRVSLIMLVVMIWITVGLPVPGMLKDYKCASAALLAMQAYRVAARAGRRDDGNNESRNGGKPGAETLAVFSCFLTGADAPGSLARQYLKPARLALLHLHALAHRRARKLADKLPACARRCAYRR